MGRPFDYLGAFKLVYRTLIVACDVHELGSGSWRYRGEQAVPPAPPQYSPDWRSHWSIQTILRCELNLCLSLWPSCTSLWFKRLESKAVPYLVIVLLQQGFSKFRCSVQQATRLELNFNVDSLDFLNSCPNREQGSGMYFMLQGRHHATLCLKKSCKPSGTSQGFCCTFVFTLKHCEQGCIGLVIYFGYPMTVETDVEMSSRTQHILNTTTNIVVQS